LDLVTALGNSRQENELLRAKLEAAAAIPRPLG
jgi:hypothetical protein